MPTKGRGPRSANCGTPNNANTISPTPTTQKTRIHALQTLTDRLHNIRRRLNEWHTHRAQQVAQEQARYAQQNPPYKSLQHVERTLQDVGHRTIGAVRLTDGTLTNDPAIILIEVHHDFQNQHNAHVETLSEHTTNLISHLPTLFNRHQRRAIHNTPFTLPELDRALRKLSAGKTPGVDRLPAEACPRLPLPLRRHLKARLWDIAIGRTPIPPEWANLVHPLYKKGDGANPNNWRPIVCATTEAKLMWMLIRNRIATTVYEAPPPPPVCGAPSPAAPH